MTTSPLVPGDSGREGECVVGSDKDTTGGTTVGPRSEVCTDRGFSPVVVHLPLSRIRMYGPGLASCSGRTGPSGGQGSPRDGRIKGVGSVVSSSVSSSFTVVQMGFGWGRGSFDRLFGVWFVLSWALCCRKKVRWDHPLSLSERRITFPGETVSTGPPRLQVPRTCPTPRRSYVSS